MYHFISFVSHYIIPYHSISYHIIPYHTISYHIIPYHLIFTYYFTYYVAYYITYYIMDHILFDTISSACKRTCLMLRMPWTLISELLIQPPQQGEQNGRSTCPKRNGLPKVRRQKFTKHLNHLRFVAVFPISKIQHLRCSFVSKEQLEVWLRPSSLCCFRQRKSRPIH